MKGASSFKSFFFSLNFPSYFFAKLADNTRNTSQRDSHAAQHSTKLSKKIILWVLPDFEVIESVLDVDNGWPNGWSPFRSSWQFGWFNCSRRKRLVSMVREKKLNVTWTVACTWLSCFRLVSIQFLAAISRSATVESRDRTFKSHDCFFFLLLFTKQRGGLECTHRVNPCRTIDWIIYTQGKRGGTK